MSHSGVLCWDHLHRYQCQQPAAAPLQCTPLTSSAEKWCGPAAMLQPAHSSQHQETLRHCHESGPRNVLHTASFHLIPAQDWPQCPQVEWSEHRPGANVGVNAMPRTPQHTSCCGAVDELGATAPQHHRTTAPPHHSTTLITVFCLQGQVRRWWRVCASRGGQVSWVQ